MSHLSDGELRCSMVDRWRYINLMPSQDYLPPFSQGSKVNRVYNNSKFLYFLNLIFNIFLVSLILFPLSLNYRNFTYFRCVEILWKDTVVRLKLCGNYTFPQDFHTRKFGEIAVFYAVPDIHT